MRTDLPAPTDNERKLSDEDFIVSKTDTRGVITYVNQAFIDISGYSESELIGEAHNIVRHPDMPKVAFKGLWDDIKQGESWQGVVKNLCKNGDYYWVSAMVTPSYKDNKIIGYMSVRRQAKEDDIESCTKLYKELKENE